MMIVYIFCRAYDRAAIKFRGIDADINFALEDYEEDMKQVLLSISCFFFLVWWFYIEHKKRIELLICRADE